MTSTAPIARLRLFGGATLEGDQGPIAGRGAQRRRIALLAILAAIRRPVSRDKIVGLLWEEADSERARKLLSESLYVIRKALGEDALIASGDDVRLNPEVVWCDVAEFNAALDRQDDAAAAEIYSGPFLEGFFIGDAPEFEKWVDTVRDTLARTRADALTRLAGAAQAGGDFAAAAAWWRKLAEQDPYNATYALGLMRALEQTGQRGAALQHARVHAALLKSEFDADPDPAIAALAQQLKEAPNGHKAVAAPVAAAPVAAVPVIAAPVIAAPVEAETIVTTPAAAEPPAVARVPEALPAPPVAADSSRWGRWAGIAAMLAIVIVGVFFVFRNDVAAPAADRTAWIAVFPFAASGSAVEWRDFMVHTLSTDLDGAGDLRTVDPNELLSRMVGERGELGPARASSIARELSADYYVLGHIMPIGQQIEISATVYSVLNDTAVITASRRGVVDSVFAVVDQIAAELVAVSGGSAEDIRQLARQTTSNLAAYKAYVTGENHYRAARYVEAVGSFSHAIKLDPKFALADYRLSAAAEWSFQFLLSRIAAERALANSDRLPEHYAPLVRGWRHFLNGDAEGARREYQAVLVNYPNDLEALSGLGEVYVHFNPPQGKPASDAQDAFARVLQRDSAYGEVRYHAMEFAARADNRAAFDSLFSGLDSNNRQHTAWEAVRAFTWGTAVDQATVISRLQKTDETEIGIAAGRIAAHTHNLSAARRIATELTRSSHSGDWRSGGHLIIAETYMGAGHLREALDEIKAAEATEKDWSIELETLFLLHPLVISTPDDIRRQRDKLLAWHPDSTSASSTFFFAAHQIHHERLRLYLLGLMNIRLGDTATAKTYLRPLEQAPGSEESHKVGVALSQSLQGHIAHARGDRKEALRLLTEATIAAAPEALVSPFFSRAHDRFVIAEINKELGAVDEAKRWYQSLLEGFDFMYVSAAHQRLRDLAERAGNDSLAKYHEDRIGALGR